MTMERRGPGPKPGSKEDALERGDILLKAGEDTGAQEVWDRNAPDYSVENRGKETVDSALRRGRELKERAMESAGSLLSGLRSRLSSIATRGLNLLYSGVGAAGHGKDLAGSAIRGTVEAVAAAPRGSLEAAKFVAGEAAGIAKGVYDLVNPEVDMTEAEKAALGNIEVQIAKLDAKLVGSDPATRDALATQIEALQANKEALLSKPRERLASRAGKAVGRGAAAAGRGAAAVAMLPVAGAAAAGSFVAKQGERALMGAAEKGADVVEKGIDVAKEKESKYLAFGLGLGEQLSKLLGKEVTLTRAQAISLGAAADAAGYGAKFFEGVADTIGALGAEDLIELVKDGGVAAKGYYELFGTKEGRAWIADNLKELNVKGGAAIGEALETVWNAGKKKAAAAGVGVLSVIAAPVVIGGSKAIEAGSRAWKNNEKSITEGIAGTVAPVLELAANIDSFQGDLKNELIKAAPEVNAIGHKAVGFFERMKSKVDQALAGLSRLYNELRSAEITDEIAQKNPETVQNIQKTIEAVKEVDRMAAEKLLAHQAGTLEDPTDVPEPGNVRARTAA